MKNQSWISIKKIGNEGMAAQLEDAPPLVGVLLQGLLDEVSGVWVGNGSQVDFLVQLNRCRGTILERSRICVILKGLSSVSS
jgi:hypothetical protein